MGMALGPWGAYRGNAEAALSQCSQTQHEGRQTFVAVGNDCTKKHYSQHSAGKTLLIDNAFILIELRKQQ